MEKLWEQKLFYIFHFQNIECKAFHLFIEPRFNLKLNTLIYSKK